MGISKKEKGFTIIESLVVVMIVAVIAGFALPSYTRMLANTRLQNKTTEWREAFYYAQREAIRLKHNILLCPSEDGEQCNCTDKSKKYCNGKADKDFNNGWIVYDVTEEKLLRDYPPSTDPQKFEITLNLGSDNELRFLNNGRPSGLSSGSVKVVYKISKNNEVKATFNIAPSGRIVANVDS